MSDPKEKSILKVHTSLIGAAAEHFVMTKLLLQNQIAALAPKGVPGVDILVSDQDGNHLFAVQVKGRRTGSDRGWRMRAKHEQIIRDSLFYCFVDFEVPENSTPKCWIIPSATVAETLIASHQAYVAKGGKDTPMRSLLPKYNWMTPDREGWLTKYAERWDSLVPISKNSD